MYCSGALDTSTHWNFSASTFSFRAANEYWTTFGSMTRTYHLANLAVVLFMFFKVSVFFGSISAGARVSRGARTSSRAGAASRASQLGQDETTEVNEIYVHTPGAGSAWPSC